MLIKYYIGRALFVPRYIFLDNPGRISRDCAMRFFKLTSNDSPHPNYAVVGNSSVFQYAGFHAYPDVIANIYAICFVYNSVAFDIDNSMVIGTAEEYI